MMKRNFSRQSFLGKDSDARIAATRVGIAGAGGGGAHIIQQLAHIGFAQFAVADPDIVENSNLNRLVGATLADEARAVRKTEVAERVIRGLCEVPQIVTAAAWQTAQSDLASCTVMFGCVDSFSEREQLERFCRRFLIPLIDIGMIVHQVEDRYVISGQVACSMPGRACLRCMGIITDERLAREAEEYGAAGDRPQVVWPNGVLASTAVGIFMQLLTPWHGVHHETAYFEYDGNANTVMPSPRLQYISASSCSHFSTQDVGDPFFQLGL
jgi:molybdopterin/thiamine biosynthesis adenylyltransferase